MITWRKRDEEWAVFGPEAEVRVGPVTVTKRSGETGEAEVVRTSAPFDVDGVPHVYGYLKKKERAPRETPEKKVCQHCGATFDYGDCKLGRGSWKEGYCGC